MCTLDQKEAQLIDKTRIILFGPGWSSAVQFVPKRLYFRLRKRMMEMLHGSPQLLGLSAIWQVGAPSRQRTVTVERQLENRCGSNGNAKSESNK